MTMKKITRVTNEGQVVDEVIDVIKGKPLPVERIHFTKNIPIPPIIRQGWRTLLAPMEVGDSFPCERRAMGNIYRVGALLGFKLVVRRHGLKGHRCWRVS